MKIEDMFIDKSATVLDALALLDKVAKKVLFVADGKKLEAVVTDGDIRRWILKKGSLDAKIAELANFNPIFLNQSSKINPKEIMRNKSIEALPIVNNNMEIHHIVFWNDQEVREKAENLDIPVIIMAGGKGTRLYPYTKILPKPLIPIGENPILEIIMDKFYEFGCCDFNLVVNYKKNMIKAYFNEVEKPYAVQYIDEEVPLGTGGGLSLLKGKVKQTFILSNCDILIEDDFRKIFKFHKEHHHIITMVCSLKNYTIPYGVVEIDKNGKLESMKEKPELAFFTNTGCYLVEPRVVEEIQDHISIGFPDIIEKYKEAGESIGIYPIGENSWMDMGQLDEMEKMRCKLQEKS